MRSLHTLLLISCLSCSPTPPVDRGAGAACVAGMTVSCACPGGGSGAQTCINGGQSYGPCQCATDAGVVTPPPPADVPLVSPPIDVLQPVDVVVTPPPDVVVSPPPADVPMPTVSVRCMPRPAAVPCMSISECNGVLQQTGMTVMEQSSETARQQEHLRSWMCNASNSESVRQFARGSSVSVGINLPMVIGFNLGSSDTEQRAQVENWQRNRCSDFVNMTSSELVRNLLRNITDNRSVISAWTECVNRVAASYDSCIRSQSGDPSGLLLVFDNEPRVGDTFSLRVRWCGTGGDISVNSASVTQALRILGARCEGASALAEGRQISIGDMSIPCVRESASGVRASLSVTVSIAGAQRGYSADAWHR